MTHKIASMPMSIKVKRRSEIRPKIFGMKKRVDNERIAPIA
jgi:hypothetical protein